MRPFAITFAGLLVLTRVAWSIGPGRGSSVRATLPWASDDNPARHEHIDTFRAAYPALNIRLDPDNGGMERVIVRCMGGVRPEMFDCYSPDQLRAYADAGIAWDLTDALKTVGVDVRRDAWPAVLPYALYDGKTCGFLENVSVDALWKSLLNP